jgi:hypothetical protein
MELFNYLLEAHKKISTFFSSGSHKYSPKDLIRVRAEAFKLQAFGRVLKRAGNKSSDEGQMIRTLGDNLKSSAKFIEDSIGELLHHMEMGEHFDNKKRVEEAELRFSIVKGDFEQHLDWIEKSLDLIKSLDLKPLYLSGLIKELKKLQGSVEDIDPELLEDGTHELRRKLRWAIMHVIYPKGLFKYKESRPKTTVFTKLTKVKEIDPIVISFDSIDFLSTSVFDLGEVKDEGLIENYSKTKSEINSSKPHIVDLTKTILADLKRNKSLKTLRKEIKEQIEELG